MHKFHSQPVLSAIGAVLMALAASTAIVTTPAQARERQTHISGANGNSATRNVQRAGGDVSSSSTGVNGKTRSRNVDRGAAGTQATVVGPNGKATTRSTAALGQGDSATTLTGPDGQTATRAASRYACSSIASLICSAARLIRRW